jgi:hypothetical protein
MNLDDGKVAGQGIAGIGALNALPVDDSSQDRGDEASVLAVWHVFLENDQKF